MIRTLPGLPIPYGVSRQADGLNFALFSKHATAVTLCLFDPKTQQLLHDIPLVHKTGDVWHITLCDPVQEYLYAYRIDGPQGVGQQYVYDAKNYLLDPYARDVATGHRWNSHAKGYLPLARFCLDAPFDWQGVVAPRHALRDLVIYEMHVRGFTQDPSSQVKHPGTFLGVIEKIPYLVDLGINAVELLPIHEFNENEVKLINPSTNELLLNFWGYSTVNYFTPMQRYASSDNPGAALHEFKTMVRELHRHNIEVILDVVFNHTAEGNQEGPILSFKGIDNPVYYILDKEKQYFNATGCGNTVNSNHPVVIELILASLRYWALEIHVDGFRFDLSACLMRNIDGEPLDPAPLITAISEDPLLAGVKLIAEPWDAVGLYRVGRFYSNVDRWSEWNDKYRDTVRRFIKGISEVKGIFISRLCGSEDLYYNRTPLSSINFVTAHDGFSLYDLVSYNEKHNIDNGEHNRDGSPYNDSWNCGEEGPSTLDEVHTLRRRQMRNFILALMVSQGVPMVTMGDEYGHTKYGNNNSWCHDSELNWFLWDRMASEEGLRRFFKLMIRFRKSNPLVRRDAFLALHDAQWHGAEPFKPNWDPNSPFIAFTLCGEIYIGFNAQRDSLLVTLPPPAEGKTWHLIADTGAVPPEDIYDQEKAPVVKSLTHTFVGFSALLLRAFLTTEPTEL